MSHNQALLSNTQNPSPRTAKKLLPIGLQNHPLTSDQVAGPQKATNVWFATKRMLPKSDSSPEAQGVSPGKRLCQPRSPDRSRRCLRLAAPPAEGIRAEGGTLPEANKGKLLEGLRKWNHVFLRAPFGSFHVSLRKEVRLSPLLRSAWNPSLQDTAGHPE